MKKIIIAISVILLACEKTETKTDTAQTICTICTESKSGYVAAEYCGTASQVAKYKSDLKKQGAQLGQSWTCRDH
jgi:hypothetical protein